MTEEEKGLLAELTEKAWRTANDGRGLFFRSFLGRGFKSIHFMELPKGLCVVGSTELEKVIRDWESPKISEDETTQLKELAKKLFSTFDNDDFDFGQYSVIRRKYKYELSAVSVTLGLIVGLIAGVSLTALFNWIF